MNVVLGIGGIVSMIAVPVISYSGQNTAIQILETKIDELQEMKKIVMADHDLIIAMASKQGIDTTKAVSLLKETN